MSGLAEYMAIKHADPDRVRVTAENCPTLYTARCKAECSRLYMGTPVFSECLDFCNTSAADFCKLREARRKQALFETIAKGASVGFFAPVVGGTAISVAGYALAQRDQAAAELQAIASSLGTETPTPEPVSAGGRIPQITRDGNVQGEPDSTSSTIPLIALGAGLLALFFVR